MVMEILPDEKLQKHIQAIKAAKDTPVRPDLMLFLDTATKYTGYAVFEVHQSLTIKENRFASLHQYGIFKAAKGDWQCRCLELTSKISSFIRQLKPGWLVMEYPTFQAGTAGMAAARSGGTLELAYLCGRISVAWEFHITKVMADTGKLFRPAYLTTFREWNGQLPKEITCQRCEDHFGIHVEHARSIENNFTDAIMLGKWFIEQSGKVGCMKGDGKAQREDY
jgi:Holliday junction resolvasome RuvABC endonuclease subunit